MNIELDVVPNISIISYDPNKEKCKKIQDNAYIFLKSTTKTKYEKNKKKMKGSIWRPTKA